MPCRDGRDDWPNRTQEATISRLSQELKKAKDDYTKMLCSACRALEAQDFDFGTNPLLDDWWAAHKAEDQARVEAELRAESARAAKAIRHKQAIQTAHFKTISELTDEERALLKEFDII